MVGIEGLGEAVSGTMLARAIEPEHGEAGEQETVCLNCGAELQGPYCHQCGQKGHVHRTLHGFGHDLLHGVFHFEGKVWRTLPMLAWRPGELTRRYVEGERARFVSPIALFLFSVFLMFASFSAIGGPFGVSDAGGRANAEASADLQRERGQLDGRIAQLEARRAGLARQGRETRVLDSQLSVLRRQRQALAATDAIVLAPSNAPPGEMKVIDLDGAEIDTGSPTLDHALEKARDNPSLMIYKLQSNAYKFSWALIPISVPFLWLLLLHRGRYRREYRAYDHTVFVTYSIAFMSLLLVALSLIRPIVGDGLAPIVLIFVPPIHMYRQLRGAYGLSRISAIWRTAVLILFAFVAAMVFFVLLLALGVMG